MGLVKHGKYVLARLTHDYKNKADQLIDIDPDEAQILGLTFEDNQDYESMYLTIEALEDGILNIYLRANKYVCYSLDNGLTWIKLFGTAAGLGLYEININSNNKILLKGQFNYSTYSDNSYFGGPRNEIQFNINFKCKLYGNILSLNYQDNFYQYNRIIPKNENSYSTVYKVYGELFKDSKIIDISNLILPIDTDRECYVNMFQNCNLLEIPIKELSTIDLTKQCYVNMFNGCTKLTKTPIIKGNTYDNEHESMQCYYGMFANCPNITDITLLCTETINVAYNNMFDDNLKYIKGTFTKYEGVDLDDLIPVGWTVRELNQETGEVVNEYVKHLNN